MALEFRVRWQRDGRREATRIYQGWDPAVRRVKAILAMEEIKDEFDGYRDMPDLVGPPMLEVREATPWRLHDYQPKPTEHTIEAMRDHARWREPAERSEAFDF